MIILLKCIILIIITDSIRNDHGDTVSHQQQIHGNISKNLNQEKFKNELKNLEDKRFIVQSHLDHIQNRVEGSPNDELTLSNLYCSTTLDLADLKLQQLNAECKYLDYVLTNSNYCDILIVQNKIIKDIFSRSNRAL